MSHKYNVSVLSSSGSVSEGQFRLFFSVGAGDNVRLEFTFQNRTIASNGTDFFGAMLDIRTILEADGYRLMCYGASKNVYPSSMSRMMGSRDRAYKLVLGHHARTSDLVVIFHSGMDVVPASIKEQKEFYDVWLKTKKT